MNNLLEALRTKIINHPRLNPYFEDRVFVVENPDDPNMMETCNKFPFLILHDSEEIPEYEPSQQWEEKLKVKFWIWQQNFQDSAENMIGREGVVSLAKLVSRTLNHDIDFEGTEYEGEEINEAEWVRTAETESVSNEKQPVAVRKLVEIEYWRSIEV